MFDKLREATVFFIIEKIRQKEKLKNRNYSKS
jgi:hypothetical protein